MTWSLYRPPASRNELLHLQKDLAIAGGMLALCVAGDGRFAVDQYLFRSRSGRVSIEATS